MYRNQQPHHNHHHNTNSNHNYNSRLRYDDRDELQPLPQVQAQRMPLDGYHQSRIAEILSSQSPTRDDNYIFGPYYATNNYELTEPEDSLRLKWMDNSPRMSRLREHRYKRLINKLEQFELWDMEQEQKQKQYELAREQRYKNITERLKSQEFCVNLMKKRHESDLETTRELEIYSNDHLYVDALDDPKTNYVGPITQYRKFQTEMDSKLKTLQQDMDSLNPRSKIEQAIIPRIERTRELYSVEPEVYTQSGKRVLKRPNLRNKYSEDRDNYRHHNQQDNHGVKFYYSAGNDSLNKPKLKPIIHESVKSKLSNGQEKKVVNFNDDVEYSNGTKEKSEV